MKKEENKEVEFGLPDILIPAEVLFNSNLTETEKILFGFLRNLSITKKGCWASNRYLGRVIDKKASTVSAAISNLKNLEYIKVYYEVRDDGSQIRRIFINTKFPTVYRNLVETWHKKIKSQKFQYDPSKKTKDPCQKNGIPLPGKQNNPSEKTEQPAQKNRNKVDIKEDIKNVIKENIYKSERDFSRKIPDSSYIEFSRKIFAEKLSIIIKTNKDINHTKATLKKWEEPIAELLSSLNNDTARVNNDLDWYAENIGKEFVPRIFSGRDLRDKFLGLEDAMTRKGSISAEGALIMPT